MNKSSSGLGSRSPHSSKPFICCSILPQKAKTESTYSWPVKEYKTLLEEPVTLSPKERQAIIEKICTPILSDYQLIHYFVMRCFARDWEGASYLIEGDIDLDALAAKKAATLCKNTIEEYTDENGTASYLCEALIDMNGNYELVVLEITVSNRKVLSATRRSSFRITSAEAAMMMNRPEYVTVYEILTDPVEFDEEFLPLVATAMQTNHENGRLFMEFKKTDHVKSIQSKQDVLDCITFQSFGQTSWRHELKVIHSIDVCRKALWAPPSHKNMIQSLCLRFYTGNLGTLQTSCIHWIIKIKGTVPFVLIILEVSLSSYIQNRLGCWGMFLASLAISNPPAFVSLEIILPYGLTDCGTYAVIILI